MEFAFTDEQKQYKKEIIEFARKELNASESMETFHADMFQKVAKFGLLGFTIGEEYGGLGGDYTTAAIAFEAFGYGCRNNGFIFAVNNHIWVSQNIIYLYGSEYLKEHYIRDMVRGEKIGAICITEAEAGSDALNMSAKAVLDGDYYVLNGSKMFISNGPIADIFIVFAVTKDQPEKRLTAFVVEKDFEGVAIGSDIEKMGLGACPTSEVVFNNCKVPKRNVLGKPDNGYRIMTAAIEWERYYEFVPHIGAMKRIMEQCIEHVKTRVAFGKTLSNYQAMTHKIAQMEINIEMAEMMMYKISWLKDKKRSAYLETSIFKVFVSESYMKACQDAIQIFGGYGYTKEYELEKELRDAVACSIYSGTNEVQRNTIYNIAEMSTLMNI